MKETLNELKSAKSDSDKKNYSSKHARLRKLLSAKPDDFVVDSNEGRILGLTHTPTGFRIHMPHKDLPAGFSPSKRDKKNVDKEKMMEKSAVVKKDEETGKWILWTKDGKKKLGTHTTPEAAYKQEYAIQKSMEKSAFIKQAANAYTQRLNDKTLSYKDFRRLYDHDVIKNPSYVDTPQRTPVTMRNGKVDFSVIPFQSPGIPLKSRSIDSKNTIAFARDKRNAALAYRKEAGIPSTPEIHIAPGRVVGAGYYPFKNKLILPSQHSIGLPGNSLEDVTGHEGQHVRLFDEGPQARGYYDVKDRLLFHKLEKRAPGILMDAPSRHNLLGHQPTISELFEEAAVEAKRAEMKKIDPVAPALRQLRVNYGRNNYIDGAIGPRARTTLGRVGGMAQIALDHTVNRLGGKKIPSNLLSGMMRILRRK